jgi:gamma-glutamyltranspeptidase/glutathione hydrolase
MRWLAVTTAFALLLPVLLGRSVAPQQSSATALEYQQAERDAAQARHWPVEPVRSSRGMVVSDDSLATAAGVEVLRAGGNAVDAAVAVAFALAVVYPEAGNLGGGGFMLIRLATGQTAFVDYREAAPQAATATMYLDASGNLIPEAATTGYRSVGVPGSVAGLALALERFGRLKLSQVLAPAIRLAEQGFPVSPRLARDLAAGQRRLERFSRSRHIFLRDGRLYQPGEIFRQPDLAATLRQIARHGPAAFYRGTIAQRLAEEMRRMGGLITEQDLAAYRPRLRTPLEAAYTVGGHRWTLITAPPPSSGGVALIEALNILEGLPFRAAAGWNDANVHLVAEALRRVFADRAAYLADPDYIPIPLRGLLNPAYAASLRQTIDPERATPSDRVRPGDPTQFAAAAAWSAWTARRPGQTTHFSVVDAAGNAVANTTTINDFFGSGVTAPGGFLLNDEMDDFTTAPGRPNELFGLLQSPANAVGPGKRPLSSMTPTIVLRDGQLSFVTGSPGGPRIISATLLSVLNWVWLGLPAQLAVNAPRFHHQWIPDILDVEPGLPAETVAGMLRRGYRVRIRGWIGQVNAIGIDPSSGARLGAADPRRGGAAAGN